jgi:hypothetical protein
VRIYRPAAAMGASVSSVSPEIDEVKTKLPVRSIGTVLVSSYTVDSEMTCVLVL